MTPRNNLEQTIRDAFDAYVGDRVAHRRPDAATNARRRRWLPTRYLLTASTLCITAIVGSIVWAATSRSTDHRQASRSGQTQPTNPTTQPTPSSACSLQVSVNDRTYTFELSQNRDVRHIAASGPANIAATTSGKCPERAAWILSHGNHAVDPSGGNSWAVETSETAFQLDFDAPQCSQSAAIHGCLGGFSVVQTILISIQD